MSEETTLSHLTYHLLARSPQSGDWRQRPAIVTAMIPDVASVLSGSPDNRSEEEEVGLSLVGLHRVPPLPVHSAFPPLPPLFSRGKSFTCDLGGYGRYITGPCVGESDVARPRLVTDRSKAPSMLARMMRSQTRSHPAATSWVSLLL